MDWELIISKSHPEAIILRTFQALYSLMPGHRTNYSHDEAFRSMDPFLSDGPFSCSFLD